MKGFDAATGMMYAYDEQKRAVVASEDGVKWLLVDVSTVAALTPDPVTVIDGRDAASLSSITIGGWTGTETYCYLHRLSIEINTCIIDYE